ncbi:MAG: hypothetical protein U9O87_03480, partial [Verrucomicrobiota bacterium]|nr:hypothetical protein [Verrucomicrobiota bacterium]
TSNAGLTYYLSKKFRIYTGINYSGKVYSSSAGRYETSIPARTITNINFIYERNENNWYSISIHNALDEEYDTAGTVEPWTQQGRWILFSAGVHF